MKDGYIAKAAWNAFVEALVKDRRVFAPCEEGEVVVFRRLAKGELPCLDRPSEGAPKDVIYPQSETLFTFSFTKDPEAPQKTGVKLDAGVECPDAVILAGRPCDARGFTVLDPVFLDIDPYYKERREHTTLVTLACGHGYAGCFCTSVGGGPADKAGSDVLVTDVGHGYYVEVLTDKGASLLEGISMEDGAPHRDEAKKEQDKAREEVGKVFEGGRDVTIGAELFASDEFWQKTAAKCLACGACTYLCPTCYCFNITDEKAVSSGERVRSWDSCMFAHFTREASSHNPRPHTWQRLKNRVGHKFLWYAQSHGGPACSGCGRCIRHCPVSVDISHIVARLAGPAPAAPEGKENHE
jgi:sulfhydrogenase subunit beta (sulfur reductase)